MSFKKRLLRILLILLLVFLFAGYFAFSTFFFSPLEGSFEPNIATIAPRDVDFFLAKERLEDDFSDFPRVMGMDEIEETSSWRTLSTSPEYARLMADLGVDESLAQLDGIQEQLRGASLLDIFGGRYLAVAGYFRGPDLKQADWVIYGRTNWLGKLGVSLLSYPGLLGLEGQGIAAEEFEDHVSLSGPNFPRPLHIARLRDVLIVSTSADLVASSLDLHARGGQDSFGQSARYFDHIENSVHAREGRELETFVDVRALLENLQVSGRWPNPSSEDLLPAFLGRLFQLGSLNEIVGVAGMGNGMSAFLHGKLSSELITATQRRLYVSRGFDRAMLATRARLAPQDASWFLYAHTDLGDTLRQAFASLEPTTRELIEDHLRSTREYNDAEEFIQDLEGIFMSRVAVVARDNDYTYTESDPPSDGEPVPALALAFWLEGGEKAAKRIDEIHQLVVGRQQLFGLRGRNSGDRGVFKNKVSGGFQIWEFWQPNMPGTGHLSSVIAGDMYIVSNSFRMIEDVLRTFFEDYPSLAERGDFQSMASYSLPQANAALWVNPRTLSPLLRKQAANIARLRVRDSIDWATERRRIEGEVLREHFPGERPNRMSPDVQEKVDAKVEPLVLQYEENVIEEKLPLIRAEMERKIVYSEMISGALFMLALDPKKIEFSARVHVPFDQ